MAPLRTLNRSPGWHCRASHKAVSVEKRIARARLFLRMDKFTRLNPMRCANSGLGHAAFGEQFVDMAQHAMSVRLHLGHFRPSSASSDRSRPREGLGQYETNCCKYPAEVQREGVKAGPVRWRRR